MSGAYVQEILNPTGPSVRATIPVPPPQGGGVVEFGRVFVSFAYSGTWEAQNFGNPSVSMDIIDVNGNVTSSEAFYVHMGRSSVFEMPPGTGLIRIFLTYTANNGPVSVLVEYQ